MVKKQKMKKHASSKPKLPFRKADLDPQVWKEKTQENRIIMHILTASYPVTAWQIQAETSIKQPIAFKILKTLEENGCVVIIDEQEAAELSEGRGPKRVWYKPTLYCIYFMCYRRKKNTTDNNASCFSLSSASTGVCT